MPTRLLLNRRLNARESAKEVRQFSFNTADPDFAYEAGDALGVWPVNDPALVREILGALSIAPESAVPGRDGKSIPVSEALARHYDVSKLTPEFVRMLASAHPGSEPEKLLSESGKADQPAWIAAKTLADRLREFPIGVSASEFVGALRQLQPRLYSISSSPKAFPKEVHLTVSIVRFECEGRRRGGVCSTFLADRAEDEEIPIFVQKSPNFRPPRDTRIPIIMVGPGTGIAPFRAFLQERKATGARGGNWLFFGEQKSELDFYYREELEGFRKDGYLQRLDLAFSRDQAEKIYVQHRMIEQGAQLWAWLQEGAYFYVCGDASRMAKDVDAALRQVVGKQGKMDPAKASAYVDGMAREKRYVRDVY